MISDYVVIWIYIMRKESFMGLDWWI